jgi:hypothetical protein
MAALDILPPTPAAIKEPEAPGLPDVATGQSLHIIFTQSTTNNHNRPKCRAQGQCPVMAIWPRSGLHQNSSILARVSFTFSYWQANLVIRQSGHACGKTSSAVSCNISCNMIGLSGVELIPNPSCLPNKDSALCTWYAGLSTCTVVGYGWQANVNVGVASGCHL